tara:strand:- start:100 stop:465 length:366 start_codon:yes stop_codon:yes gene_type:complete
MSNEKIQTLAKIAEQCRIDKKNGIFKSYRDAYRAAVDSIFKNEISVNQLENAYYNSKRSKNDELKKIISIPIMITQEMRLKLKGLKYSNEEIRHLTPKRANEIIQNQLINKNPSLNHGLNQ